MNSVIITGADGFVGSKTCEYFAEKGVNVFAIDVAEKPKRIQESVKIKYLQCDVFNEHSLKHCLEGINCEIFIHFAWVGSAGDGRTDYNLQMNNAIKTVEIMKIAKELGCIRFLCAGSIMEYEVEDVVHAQTMKPGMPYIYGMGKLMAHCMCKSVAANIGIELLWPMITNAYGVGEFSPRFINTTIRKVIREEELQFTSATQNYDFVYVDDVARAFYLIAEKGIPFKEYIIGSGDAKPLKEFLLDLRNAICPGQELVFGDIPYTGVDTPIERFDVSELVNDCGYEPLVSFKEGISKTYEWLKREDF